MDPRVVRPRNSSLRIQVRSADADSGPGTEEKLARLEQAAFDRGYGEGERAGRERGEQIADAASRQFARAAEAMAASYRKLTAAAERNTVELALEIARKIVRRELTADSKDAAALAVAVTARVSAHAEIVIRVSRANFATVQEAVSAVDSRITVKEDPALADGDFVIDTAQTHLDGRIDSQIEMIGRTLLNR